MPYCKVCGLHQIELSLSGYGKACDCAKAAQAKANHHGARTIRLIIHSKREAKEDGSD